MNRNLDHAQRFGAKRNLRHQQQGTDIWETYLASAIPSPLHEINILIRRASVAGMMNLPKSLLRQLDLRHFPLPH